MIPSTKTPHYTPLLLLGLIILFAPGLALTNLILGRGDTFLYFYPYWEAAAAALHAGRLPWWNPHLFMGAPLLANSQMGFFYPLNWPLWYLLPIPYATKATIILHLWLAALGTYTAARRVWHLNHLPALYAATLFTLGGYLTAQIEHINQLQGIAWLPWFFLVWAATHRPPYQRLLGLALLFTLQLLAGHSQTTFLTGMTLGFWWLARFPRSDKAARHLWFTDILLLAGAALLALPLAAPQLIPTLELTNLSARQGGLSWHEVVSFSWHPLIIPRALLPAYNQSLFTEYVAFFPLTTLLLAGYALTTPAPNHHPNLKPLAFLALLGLLLALGRFNPLYLLLGRLPGFNLFRVPARWLLLYAFATPLLAAHALQNISHLSTSAKNRWPLLPLLALATLASLAPFLGRIIPFPPESPPELPNLLTYTLWLLELALFFALINIPALHKRLGLKPLLTLLTFFSLFLASRALPYNNLTTPNAYFEKRPPVLRLQASAATDNGRADRFLSMSPIFFDPGDLADIHLLYDDQLPPAAVHDYIVALKHQAVIGPNLSMVHNLYAVDGFDGGILPLGRYRDWSRLFLPNNTGTTDGRLRENLTSLPPANWLDAMNARYLITDKVGDLWHEGIFFDRQLPLTITHPTAAVAYFPPFPATGLRLLTPAPQNAPPLTITFADNSTLTATPQPIAPGIATLSWPNPAQLTAITITHPLTTSWPLQAITLINNTDNSFQPLTLGHYRLLHSGDVKIYDNLDVLPPAFLVYDWSTTTSPATALPLLQQPTFDPRHTAIIETDVYPPPPPNTLPLTPSQQHDHVTLTQHTPEHLTITATTPTSATLILTDAYYPGWQATRNQQPTPIYPANILWRALHLPPGTHTITMTYHPLP
ncbi:MAG TPA: YfhO family protein [Anaerolineae bacterium]|nr:YfhO family protein [Anaerolineae bacterium]